MIEIHSGILALAIVGSERFGGRKTWRTWETEEIVV
jgi:hypothetical protein